MVEILANMCTKKEKNIKDGVSNKSWEIAKTIDTSLTFLSLIEQELQFF